MLKNQKVNIQKIELKSYEDLHGYTKCFVYPGITKFNKRQRYKIPYMSMEFLQKHYKKVTDVKLRYLLETNTIILSNNTLLKSIIISYSKFKFDNYISPNLISLLIKDGENELSDILVEKYIKLYPIEEQVKYYLMRHRFNPVPKIIQDIMKLDQL